MWSRFINTALNYCTINQCPYHPADMMIKKTHHFHLETDTSSSRWKRVQAVNQTSLGSGKWTWVLSAMTGTTQQTLFWQHKVCFSENHWLTSGWHQASRLFFFRIFRIVKTLPPSLFLTMLTVIIGSESNPSGTNKKSSLIALTLA